MNAQIYPFDPACQTECEEIQNFFERRGKKMEAQFHRTPRDGNEQWNSPHAKYFHSQLSQTKDNRKYS
jgi:hypothetical protein